MNKLLAASAAAMIALTPAVAMAGNKLAVPADDPVVPMADPVLPGPGINTATAVAAGIGALLLVGALAGGDSDDSTGTTE